jgi:hypothetical protein
MNLWHPVAVDGLDVFASKLSTMNDELAFGKRRQI